MRTRTNPSKSTPIDPPAGTSSINRSGPSAVTYHIPNTPAPHPLKTTIQLPPSSHWTSGLHFHTTHTEYLRLVRGSITVQLGTALRTFSASAGGEINSASKLVAPGLVVTVPKYARHNWGRADYLRQRRQIGGKGEVPSDWSDDVVVEEWTDPSDLAKPLFFWNLNGIIVEEGDRSLSSMQKMARWVLGGWWIPFRLFVIFWELDNWPVFLSLEGLGMGTWLEHSVEFIVTFFVLLGVSVIAKVVDLQAVNEELTPKKLWVAWQGEKKAGRRED